MLFFAGAAESVIARAEFIGIRRQKASGREISIGIRLTSTVAEKDPPVVKSNAFAPGER